MGRTKNERTALFRNLVHSLILHQKIETTQAKANAIKGLVDRIISQAKSPTAKRLVTQFLANKSVEEKFHAEIMPNIGSRVSGFTSITKVGKRLGDNGMVVQMKLLLEESSGKSLESSKATKKKVLKSDTDEVAMSMKIQDDDKSKKEKKS